MCIRDRRSAGYGPTLDEGVHAALRRKPRESVGGPSERPVPVCARDGGSGKAFVPSTPRPPEGFVYRPTPSATRYGPVEKIITP